MVKNYFFTYCRNNLKAAHNLMCILSILFVFGFSGNVLGQSISSPTVGGVPVCAGTDFTISYTVRNGNKDIEKFTTSTNYTAYVGNVVNGTLEVQFSFPFISDIIPDDGNNKETVITQVISIPNDTPGSSNYVIGVSSTTPNVNTTTITVSNAFTIKSKPVITATNNGALCIGEILQLSASNISGATYNWTGPNGFTSSLPNPTINNVNSSNGGNYFVTATNNGCTSLTATTTVEIIDTISWTGSEDTNWNTAGNWSCNNIPTIATNAIIPAGLTKYPILSSGAIGTINNLTLEAGASLEVQSNLLKIAGILTSNGNMDTTVGDIEFNGTSVQQIPENSFLNNRVRNLTINNEAGVISSAIIEATEKLEVFSGNFQTGDKLTLISNATQTALLQVSVDGTITGNVTMQRYLDPAIGYKYFSSPFQSTVVNDFANVIDLTATFPNFYRYNENRANSLSEDATGFEKYTSASSPLNILEGYALNFGSGAGPKLVEISGAVNNGSQQINLSHNNGTYTKGFNLVGNPYPSPIDWNASSGWTKDNVDNAIYFFTASNQYTGAYSSYVNGVQSGGGTSMNIIPSMQGFFVHVTDSPTNSYPVYAALGVTNEVRITDFSQPFYKSPFEDSFALIRLNAAYDAGGAKDETVVYFNNYATQAFDRDYDALKLMNTDPTIPNLYSISGTSELLSINAVPDLRGSQEARISLGLNVQNEGWITISLKNKEEISSSSDIYLIDLEKRTSVNLNDKTEYRFYATSGKDEKRFQLLLSDNPISDPAIIFNELFSVDQRNGAVKIKMNLDIGKVGDIKVATVTGQILDTQFVTSNDEIEINGIKSSGLYFISFYSEEGIVTKKILIQK